MTKYALFIEPSGQLLDFIIDWKHRFETQFPRGAYCSHPPHSTLLFCPIREPALWLQSLSLSLKTTSSFELTTSGPIAFPRDPCTHGGHTLAIGITTSSALIKLQELVATATTPHIDRYLLAPTDGLLAEEPFKSSYITFGFPFVGSHWLPHFSIASPQIQPNHPLVREFESTSMAFRQAVQCIGVWAIDGDRHVRLNSISLNLPSHAHKR